MSTRTKMGRTEARDTKIPVVDPSEKSPSNVIECSVNMNVSLSNAKRSKIFHRAQSLLILILAIIFAILCFHLKREVRALEVQMNCVNSNLMILMLRYDKLNKNFNRIWYHKVANQHRAERDFENPGRVLHGKAARKLAIDNSPRPNATDIEQRLLDKSWRLEVDGNMLEEARTLDDRVGVRDAESADRERHERAIVAFGRRNHEASTAQPGLPDDITDDTNSWNEPRAGRSRRDEGRGKKRRKIKRRLKRSRRRLGPLVATFVGAVPEQHVTDTVYVGPWVKSPRNDSRYAFNKFHLVEDKMSIEVTANGLYMISAQMYYFGNHTHYSYWILLSSEGTSITRNVIKCATVSANTETEASCYTSVVLPLRRGDRLHIQQQERDRLISLREGHSYVQIMLLSGESKRRGS